jgi:hypothetical protein
MKDHKLLAAFFWFTFAAFLAPSIPHIAYFFQSFEPDAVGLEAVVWSVVCYAIALSIDGTILWLSRCAAQGTAGKGYRGAFWFFIAFLTALSWFLNWVYAVHHLASATAKLSGAIEGKLFGIAFLPLALVEPMVASMFPVLAIMFTFMAGKVVAERPKTVEEVEREADELARRLGAQQRLVALRDGHKVHRLTSLLDAAKDVATHIKGQPAESTRTSEERAEGPEEDLPADSGESAAGHHAGYASDPEKDTAQTETLPSPDRQAAPFLDTKRIMPEGPVTTSRRPASAIYATFADAARETGYAEEYLKKLARKGQLRTAKNEKGFLLVSSLNAYLERRGRTRIQAEHRPALQLVKDEQRMKDEQDVDTPQASDGQESMV